MSLLNRGGRINLKKKFPIRVVTYKVPIDEKYDDLINPYLELTDDMIIDKEDMELESAFKLDEIARNVRGHNTVQVKFAKELNKNTINHKRIVKIK